MVSNVSFGNSVNNNNNVEFAKKAMKYIQGQKIEEQSLGSELISGATGNIAFSSFFNRKDIKTAILALKNKKDYDSIAEAYDAISKGKKAASELKTIEKVAKKAGMSVEEYKAAQAAMEAEKIAEAAKKMGMSVEEYSAKVAEGVIKPEGVLSFITKPVKQALSTVGDKTGITKLATAFAKKFPKISKIIKGNAVFFAFQMIISTITEIKPAFKKGGIKEGFKQLGRSLAKSGINTAGFAVGAKIGSLIGTYCFPGLGTAIGGIIGSILGMAIGGALSTIADRGTEKILGKDFSKQQAEAEEQAQAEAIASSPEAMNKLKEAVEEKIAQDTQTGKKKAIKNAEIMYKELQNLPQTETSDEKTSLINFNSATATHAINNAVRLNAQNTTNPINQTGTTPATTQMAWYPKTMGEATSGLYDQTGMLSIPKFQAIA